MWIVWIDSCKSKWCTQSERERKKEREREREWERERERERETDRQTERMRMREPAISLINVIINTRTFNVSPIMLFQFGVKWSSPEAIYGLMAYAFELYKNTYFRQWSIIKICSFCMKEFGQETTGNYLCEDLYKTQYNKLF